MRITIRAVFAAIAFGCACGALALTQAEHDSIVKDVDVAVQKYVTAPAPAVPALLTVEMVDAATIASAAGVGNMALPWAFNPEFLAEPTGFKYLRFSSDTGPRLISWYLPIAPRAEAYFAHAMYIETDAKTGLNPAALGVKLPGLGNDNVPGELELLSLRMEHGLSDPANPGSYALRDYFYDAENASLTYPPTPALGFVLHDGRWYWIEQHVKLNTPGVADGVLEVRIDGALVYSRSNVLYRGNAATQLKTLHMNYYEGGNAVPLALHHYRIGRIMVAAASTPRPSDLPAYVPPPPPASQWPAWRASLPLNAFASIPNTSSLGFRTTNSATVNAWNGLTACASTWYSALSGGHQDSSENAVYALDLLANAPQWVTLNAGSANATPNNALYYADGLPASRHTYFSGQCVASRNRLMTFSATATNVMALTSPVVDGFNMTTNAWDAAGTWASVPFSQPVSSIASDPRTGDAYVAGNYHFAKWTASTGAWSTITPGGIGPWAWSWEFKGSFVDTIRNQWVALNGNLLRIDLGTSAASTITLTGPCAGNSADYSSTVHATDIDRYITVLANGNVCAINPTTGASTVVTTAPAAVNGVSNRLAYFDKLGGVAYLPSYASNVLFMPTR